MPEIRPFRALRYQLTQTGNPADLVAFPSELQSAERAAMCRQRSPFNVGHLGLPPDEAQAAAVSALAERGRQWRSRGVLRRDGEPALYVYEQTHSDELGRCTRRGLFAALRLQPPGRDILLPHRIGRADAARAEVEALGLHTAAVLALYDDPAAEVDDLLATSRSAFPDLALTDIHGVEHRLFPVNDVYDIERVGELFRSKTLLIGQGQTRYQAALAMQNDAEAAVHPAPRDFVLAYLSNTSDRGFKVRPYHLVLENHPAFEFHPFLKHLSATFDLEQVRSIRDADGIVAALAEAGQSTAAFAVIGGGAVGRRAGYIARLAPGRVADRLAELATRSDRLPIDSVLLNELLLRDQLGIEPAHVETSSYVRYVDNVDAAMQDGRAKTTQLVILRNATPAARLFEICRDGGTIPRRTALFYPPCLAGLLFYDLQEF